jgi:hypothetical protein
MSGVALRRGAPEIGAAVPAWSIAALGLVAGLAGAVVTIGGSGWLVVAAILAVGAAVLPRAPFGALLVVQLVVAGVYTGPRGPVVDVVLLLTTHLVLVTGMLGVWMPRSARVQLRSLRPTAVRFLLVQLGVQAVGVAVLVLHGSGVRPGTALGAAGALWIGIAAAVALLVVAVLVLVPILRR